MVELAPVSGSTRFRAPWALCATIRVEPSAVAWMPLLNSPLVSAAGPLRARVERPRSAVDHRDEVELRGEAVVNHARPGDGDVVDHRGGGGELVGGDGRTRVGVVDVALAGEPPGDEEQSVVDVDPQADRVATRSVVDELLRGTRAGCRRGRCPRRTGRRRRTSTCPSRDALGRGRPGSTMTLSVWSASPAHSPHRSASTAAAVAECGQVESDGSEASSSTSPAPSSWSVPSPWADRAGQFGR